MERRYHYINEGAEKIGRFEKEKAVFEMEVDTEMRSKETLTNLRAQ